MMGIYFGAVTTTGVTNTNQLQFDQTKLHSLAVDVGGSMIGSVKKEPMQFVTVICLSGV